MLSRALWTNQNLLLRSEKRRGLSTCYRASVYSGCTQAITIELQKLKMKKNEIRKTYRTLGWFKSPFPTKMSRRTFKHGSCVWTVMAGLTAYRIRFSSAFESLGVINIDWRSIVGQTTLFEPAAITRNLFSKIEQQKSINQCSINLSMLHPSSWW